LKKSLFSNTNYVKINMYNLRNLKRVDLYSFLLAKAERKGIKNENIMRTGNPE